MNTQLDERQELAQKIEKLSHVDIQKVRIFIAGVEAGRTARENECVAAETDPKRNQ